MILLLVVLKRGKKLSQFFDRAYMVASEPAWIDIANVNVHKGTTVAHLQRLLNVLLKKQWYSEMVIMILSLCHVACIALQFEMQFKK